MTGAGTGVSGTAATALRELHDAVLFDLDGTLFRGGAALPGAAEALRELSRGGRRIGYLTNNGSRNAGQVAEHLRALGFAADEGEVVTSGQAAARALAERLEPGTPVLVVGTKALADQVTSAGLGLAARADDARAVVQGHSQDTAWADLAEACLAIRAGAFWVACNLDATLPEERGELPGNGAMVAALRVATGVEPLVAGKPEPPLFAEAVRRTGAGRPLMVGDRLGTDIAGAKAAGLPSLLVLTGVTDAATLLAAPPEQRPDYIGADLSALASDAATLRAERRAPWRARREGADLVLSADATEAGDPVDALRTLCAAHWADDSGPVTTRATDETSAEALAALGLPAGA